jgi:hypothetical protein
MNNPKNKTRSAPKSALPFFIEFVKFATGFAVIIAVGLFTLHAASVALQ